MHYYSFNQYLRARYGTKVRKISLNAGFSCPNRDQARGQEGCVFCNELGFSRFAGGNVPLKEQIERSIESEKERTGAVKFIAYFQNAANTHAPVEELRSAYDVIKGYPEIVALSISTRPDCADDEKLDLIREYASEYEVWVEYGVQTAHDRSLDIMRRGHSFEQAADAIKRTAARGIKAAAHVILGIPGEKKEDMIATARKLSTLPLSGVKIHILHVLKDTELERMFARGEVELLTRDEYVGLACDFLENTRPDCVVLRLLSDAKKEYLVAPAWINDKLDVMNRVEAEFDARGTRQGSSLP